MNQPTRWVVDASVAAKWFVPESASPRARALLAGPDQLLAPDIIVPEFGNIFWKKVRRGEVDGAAADRIIQVFLILRPVALYSSRPLLRSAFDVATTYGRTVYDSLHLALALAEGCRLVTADERLVNSLQATPLAGSVAALASV